MFLAHDAILYDCAHAYVYIALEIVRLRSDVLGDCLSLLSMTKAVLTANTVADKCLL